MSKCPYIAQKQEIYTVHFEPVSKQNLFGKLVSCLKDIGARISPSSIKAAYYIGTQNDLSQPLLHAWKPGSYVSEFSSPAGTVYVTADPIIMKAIFANSRRSADGLFYDYENQRLFVEGILKDLYPEDLQRIGVDKAVDMLVISSATPHASTLRAPMIKSLSPSSVSNYSAELIHIADTILKSLTEKELENLDAAEISFEYAITVISKLFVGYDTSREGYQQLAKALDAFSKRMTRIVSHRKSSDDEAKDYAQAITVMKSTINGALLSPSPYIQGLIDLGWNDFQIKSNLFFLYFAGTETTASAMNYLIWQLGRIENSALQKEIRESIDGHKILLKAIAETLRLHPPAFIEGRQLREDALMTLKDKNKHTFWEKKLRKGHSIVCLTHAAGLDPNQYPNPREFNPYRFQDQDPRIAALSFMPFGGGPHICPGQHLALAELQTLLYQMVKHFSIHTLSPETTEQKGFFTLRATPAKIKLEPL